MKLKPHKNDWLAIVVVSLAAGILLMAISATEFIHAIQKDSGVARFVSGLVLLICSFLRLIQRKQDATMMEVGIAIGEARAREGRLAEQAAASNGDKRP